MQREMSVTTKRLEKIAQDFVQTELNFTENSNEKQTWLKRVKKRKILKFLQKGT